MKWIFIAPDTIQSLKRICYALPSLGNLLESSGDDDAFENAMSLMEDGGSISQQDIGRAYDWIHRTLDGAMPLVNHKSCPCCGYTIQEDDD